MCMQGFGGAQPPASFKALSCAYLFIYLYIITGFIQDGIIHSCAQKVSSGHMIYEMPLQKLNLCITKSPKMLADNSISDNLLLKDNNSTFQSERLMKCEHLVISILICTKLNLLEAATNNSARYSFAVILIKIRYLSVRNSDWS